MDRPKCWTAVRVIWVLILMTPDSQDIEEFNGVGKMEFLGGATEKE